MAPTIVRESSSGQKSSSDYYKSDEDQKEPDGEDKNQMNVSTPSAEQLQSYEKMVAQMIRESIEKENRQLKEEIKRLQMNE